MGSTWQDDCIRRHRSRTGQRGHAGWGHCQRDTERSLKYIPPEGSIGALTNCGLLIVLDSEIFCSENVLAEAIPIRSRQPICGHSIYLAP